MQPRKRFGQHFLKDASILQRITDAVAIQPKHHVFEIGPGQGALTQYLHQPSLARYLAVEIDRDLAPLLPGKFPGIEGLQQDVLRTDLTSALAMGAKTQPWRVVGNLPYNISSPLLMKMIEFLRTNPRVIGSMIFMFQKELASRLIASKGSKQGRKLSIYSQLFMEAELLFDVHPESFSPPPKVMSSVLRITPREDQENQSIPSNLSAILNVAFSARRKTLQNVFKDYSVDWETLQIRPTLRPDQLGEKDYLKLSRALL